MVACIAYGVNDSSFEQGLLYTRDVNLAVNVALFPSKALTVHRSGVESENDDVIRKRSLIG